MSLLSKLLPNYRHKNVGLYYILCAATSAWFVEAVWYFYWSRFASYGQISIIFATLTLIGLFLDIPTGAIADIFGRKFCVVLGIFLLFVGGGVLAAAWGIPALWLGGLIQNIGRAFVSGSLNALLYDDLKAQGREADYDDVVSAEVRLCILVFGICVAIGGWLYPISFRLPHILMTIALGIGFLASLYLDDHHRFSSHFSLSQYLRQNLSGFRELFKPSFRLFALPIFLNIILFHIYDWGFAKPAMSVNFGFFSKEQGIILPVLAVLSAIFVGFLPQIRSKVSDYRGLWLTNIFIGFAYFFSFYKLGIYGFFVLLAIELAGNLAAPWISTVVNQHTRSADRATTLSSLDFIAKLPYVIVILITGQALEGGWVNTLHLAIGLFALIISLGGIISSVRY